MGDLVTVEELRDFVKTGLSDDSLDMVIDANEQAVLARLGPLGAVTDIRWPRGDSIILLGRRVGSVTSITERYDTTDTVLDEDDYVIDGNTIRRIDTGAHPRTFYVDRTTIVYVPEDDEARRKLAVIKLCGLDVAEVDAGAVIQRTVGQHSVRYGTAQERAGSRDEIWAELENALAPLFA